MQQRIADYTFCLASHVDAHVRLRVDSLLHYMPASGSDNDAVEEWCQLECVITAHKKPLTPPISTSLLLLTRTDHGSVRRWTAATNTAATNTRTNNHWLHFPIKYRDLPPGSTLCVRCEPLAIQCSFSLFGAHRTLRKARHKLILTPIINQDATMSPVTDELERRVWLDKVLRRWERGDVAKNTWMDAQLLPRVEHLQNAPLTHAHNQQHIVLLSITLPRFDFPIIALNHIHTLHHHHHHNNILWDEPSTLENLHELKHRKLVRSHRHAPHDRDLKPNSKTRDDLLRILQQPPTHRLSPSDCDLLYKFRYYLASTGASLAGFRGGWGSGSVLTRVLRAVDWRDPVEVRHITEQWLEFYLAQHASAAAATGARVRMEDVLELLGRGFANRKVRGWAVRQLDSVTDAELELYLLQLVQAIKFENLTSNTATPSEPLSAHPQLTSAGVWESGLVEFLCQRCSRNASLANAFYWYLMLELDDGSGSLDYLHASPSPQHHQQHQPATPSPTDGNEYREVYAKVWYHLMHRLSETPTGQSRLRSFHAQSALISRLTQLTQTLRALKLSRPKKIEWLRATLADAKNGWAIFKEEVEMPLLGAGLVFRGVDVDTASVFKSHLAPLKLTFLTDVASANSSGGGGGAGVSGGVGGTAGLGSTMVVPGSSASPGSASLMASASSPRPSLALSTASTSTLNPITSTSATSAPLPLLPAPSSSYTLIFKLGDDLRQDQLVLQMISLMDKILRDENVDLKLTPYKVLATGVGHGVIQYVESVPLASILAEYQGSLLAYFREIAPSSTVTTGTASHLSTNPVDSMTGGADGSLGVDEVVMDTYIKSCAGYAVIMYILGVGDRHLDNLMITPRGHLFHIDFGYILGRDPKPFPPPIKLCREMVDAMGGLTSHHFSKFKSLSFTAFSILRKHANLLLNVINLMTASNIGDLRSEPDLVVRKVEEKMRLDLVGEEEAMAYFDGVIGESVSALFPVLVETVHKWAQYWRK